MQLALHFVRHDLLCLPLQHPIGRPLQQDIAQLAQERVLELGHPAEASRPLHDDRYPPSAMGLVVPQRRGGIALLAQALRQHHCILDGLARSLAEVRCHWVGCIPKEANPPFAPVFSQGVTVVDVSLHYVALVGHSDQLLDRLMPAPEGSQQKFLSAPSGCAVRALRRVLGRGPVDSPSANTGKKEPRSPPPGLDRSLGDELALGPHHSAPSGIACVSRQPVAQESLSHRRVQAISAYEEVGALLSAASERCPHVALRLLKADALSAEMHVAPCLRKPLQ